MNELNPELESQLNALADLCCSALNRSRTDFRSRAKPLLQALLVGGFERLSDENLRIRLEARALERCKEKAIHRRAELASVAGDMHREFESLVREQVSAPKRD